MESQAEIRSGHMKDLKAATASRKSFHKEANKHLAAPPQPTAVQAYALGNLPSGSDDDSQPGTRDIHCTPMPCTPAELPMAEEPSHQPAINYGTGIGESSAVPVPAFVPDGDRAILQHQFQQQDDALDLISAAMDHLQHQAAEMNGILSQQACCHGAMLYHTRCPGWSVGAH